MIKSYSHYEDLAELFSYPEDDFPDRIQRIQILLNEKYPEAAQELEHFFDFAEQASVDQMQELFLRTFDVQAITTLDIGYVLFGDDYKRGAMLVHLNREHELVDNPCHNELADHLPNVLRLLPRLKDSDFRAELVDQILAPALRKIIGEFSVETISQKEKVYLRHHKTLIESSVSDGTLYRYPLLALYRVLRTDFHLTIEETPETASSFLMGIGTEIQLEANSA